MVIVALGARAMTELVLPIPEPTAVEPLFVPRPEAVLTTEQVARWLQVSVETVRQMNLPAVAVGRGKRQRWRYIAGQVLDALAKRAE